MFELFAFLLVFGYLLVFVFDSPFKEKKKIILLHRTSL